jgi:hypothetical protein
MGRYTSDFDAVKLETRVAYGVLASGSVGWPLALGIPEHHVFVNLGIWTIFWSMPI